MACFCNVINIETSGGISLAGSAVESCTAVVISGGIVAGGSALVDMPSVWDGVLSVWPLDDASSPYLDVAGGNDGTSDNPPTLDDGVFCLGCQTFTEDENIVGNYILIPEDTIGDHAFTVSCWVKIQDIYKPRIIFARGESFTLGYSFLNHLVASVTNTDGDTVDAFSSDIMQQDYWYHVAATYSGDTLTVFINGIEKGSVVASDIATPTSGYIGRKNDAGGYMTGSVQELRLYPEVRTADWLVAEHDTFCDPNFVIYGTVEGPVG